MSASVGVTKRASQLSINHIGSTIKHEKRLYSVLGIDHKASHVVIDTRTGRGTQKLILPLDTEVTVTA